MKRKQLINLLVDYWFPWRLNRGALIVLLLLFFQTTSYAKNLVVGAMDFPPFYILGEKGAGVTGINIDIVSSVLDKMGENYEIKGYPVKRLYSNIIKGRCNIFYGIRVPEKVLPTETVLFSNNKISKITLRAYSIGDTPVVQKKEDLIGQSVIVLRGYAYGGFIKYLTNPKTNIKVQIADKQDYSFKMLKKKRAHYLLAFERHAKNSIKQLAEGGYTLPGLKHGAPLFVADGYFIVSKKTPDAKNLLARMEVAYESLVKSGAFKGLIEE